LLSSLPHPPFFSPLPFDFEKSEKLRYRQHYVWRVEVKLHDRNNGSAIYSSSCFSPGKTALFTHFRGIMRGEGRG
jgi:hypothetical protein